MHGRKLLFYGVELLYSVCICLALSLDPGYCRNIYAVARAQHKEDNAHSIVVGASAAKLQQRS